MSVSLNLIVGFLGAGKTTLIKELVPMSSKKIAIIENEFGEVNIDEELLSNEGLVFDISSGCLCCSMRGDLIVNLKKILDEAQDVEHIFIEATGVAQPGPIVETILSSDYFNKNFNLKSVITVFDETSFMRAKESNDEEALALMASQVSMANFCYLTKGEKEAQSISFIKSQNPMTQIVYRPDAIDIEEDFLAKNIEQLEKIEGQYPFNEIIMFDSREDFLFSSKEKGRFAYFMAASDFENNKIEAVTLFASKMAVLSHGQESEMDVLYSLSKEGELPKCNNEDSGHICLAHSFSQLEVLKGKILERFLYNSSVRFSVLINAHAYDIEGRFNLEKLQLFINFTLFQYGERLYRSKGIVNLDDGRILLFQGVYSTFTFEIIPDRKEKINKIIFIGKGLKSESIHAGLLNCLG